MWTQKKKRKKNQCTASVLGTSNPDARRSKSRRTAQSEKGVFENRTLYDIQTTARSVADDEPTRHHRTFAHPTKDPVRITSIHLSIFDYGGSGEKNNGIKTAQKRTSKSFAALKLSRPAVDNEKRGCKIGARACRRRSTRPVADDRANRSAI